MAIVMWPDDIQIDETVTCVACSQDIMLSQATAGAVSADGEQAFACNDHFWNGSQLIRSWTDFALVQQMAQIQRDLRRIGEEI